MSIKAFLLAGVTALLISTSANGQSTVRSAPQSFGLIESYIAQIGYQDLYNSSGQRLTRPWQVIRQDRANYHRFGRRDRLDQGDSFFADELNRSVMEDLVSKGSISPAAARDILSGDALILVEIHGTGYVGREVHITVAR